MANEDTVKRCSEASARIRRQILEMTYETGSAGAHIGGSLSMVELLACLYVGCIQFDSQNPCWEDRDRVILSKGHAAMALYSAMAEAGIIEMEELKTFKKDGSRLGGHPSLNGLPGIEFASGSLGQGLSLGVGTCLGLRRKGNTESRVYVFLGDGECDEGSVWEAAASAAQYNLKNLVAVIDVNGIQYDGDTNEILNLNPFESKWEDFGWETICIDGHDIGSILKAYSHIGDKPLAILAHTIKGKGISFMENNWKYHNASLTKKLYEQALEELEAVK